MAQDKRKTKIVNPSYQYRAAYITTLAAVIIVNLFVVVASLLPEGTGIAVDFSRNAYYALGIIEIVLIAICWRWSIVSTHRIAGPVFAIDRELKNFREGKLDFAVVLRPRDEFQDAASSINDSIHSLRDAIAGAQDLALAAEREPSADNLQQLREALARFDTGQPLVDKGGEQP